MKYYKTYNFAAVLFLVAFSGFVGMLFFGSEPQPADAVQMPQQAVLKQPLSSDNGSSVTNLVSVDDISDGAYTSIDNDEESVFMWNSLGELSPIEISSGDLGSSTDLASEMDLGAESGTRTIQSGSADAAASSVAADASGTGSSGSAAAGSATPAVPDSTTPAVPDSTAPSGGGGSGSSGGGSTDTDDLSKLQPLPKVHYSWGLTSGTLLNDRENSDLYELARLTHSLCVAGERVRSIHIDNFVYICASINKTNPEIPCSIGINYSPWHQKFRPELGLFTPIPKQYNSTIFADPTYNAEIEQFVYRMNLVKQWVKESNQKYKADVKVGAILLDSERFYVRSGDEEWNENIRKALDAIHIEAAKLFPDARIEWYGRSMTGQGSQWVSSGLHTGKEITPSLSCSLYRLPEQEYTRQVFLQTCNLADKMEVSDVTPWLAIGAGGELNSLGRFVWIDDFDFDTNFSYQVGKNLNSTSSPFDRAKIVVFFPDPFNPLTPAWKKHFVKYCSGAAKANK